MIFLNLIKVKVDHFSWELDKYEVKKDVLGSLESVASKVYWNCFWFHILL